MIYIWTHGWGGIIKSYGSETKQLIVETDRTTIVEEIVKKTVNDAEKWTLKMIGQ